MEHDVDLGLGEVVVVEAAGTDVQYSHRKVRGKVVPFPEHRLLSGPAQKIKALEEAILNVSPTD